VKGWKLLERSFAMNRISGRTVMNLMLQSLIPSLCLEFMIIFLLKTEYTFPETIYYVFG